MATPQLTKIDLRAQLKWLYQPSAKEPREVAVPPLHFLMIDGEGDPNTAPFAEAVAALYATAYTLKFMVRNGSQAIDYPVMPLEGLWWTTDGPPATLDRRENWRWTAMIMQPEYVTPELVERARAEVFRKKGLSAVERVRFEPFDEGLAAQIMHRGPFADEPATLAKLHAFITGRGRRLRGKHHEIYLSDPLRTAPEKLKTVLRQPFE
jgi:hypothetical protein